MAKINYLDDEYSFIDWLLTASTPDFYAVRGQHSPDRPVW